VRGRATERPPVLRCVRRRPVRCDRVQYQPGWRPASAGNPPACATTTGRSQHAPPGRRKLAAIIGWQAVATDEACGRSGPTVPARSAAGRQDRARGASGWGCRAAAPRDCRSFPWRSARARRAREAKRDQGQVVEIPGFQAWETGHNRSAKAGRRRFPASGGLPVRTRPAYRFMIRSCQGVGRRNANGGRLAVVTCSAPSPNCRRRRRLTGLRQSLALQIDAEATRAVEFPPLQTDPGTARSGE
jgi:hypothetical protein